MSKDKKSEEDYLEKYYTSPDISSATECTGMVPAPPLTEAEVEGYADVYAAPQKKATQAAADGGKKRRGR